MSDTDGLHGIDKEMAAETEMAKEQRTELRQRGKIMSNIKRLYKKEATITIDVSETRDGNAENIIKAITKKIGVEGILAVRPKQQKQYEVTMENEDLCDELLNGLDINGQMCEVKKLEDREYVVSFMHLPVYLEDDEITTKLEGWGVIPVSTVKRRCYPGTNIEDGTRFIKAKFPREVASLPYSTRFETAEGTQHFRVIHNKQVKTCRLCMSPEHILKDCPDFKCRKCEEHGHFARECNAVKCPDCFKTLNKCECWRQNNEEEEEQQMNGQMHNDTTEMQETNEQEKQYEITGGERHETSEEQEKEEQQEVGDKEERMEEDKSTEETLSRGEELNVVELAGEEGKKNQTEAQNDKGRGIMPRRKQQKVTPNLELAKRKRQKQVDNSSEGLRREEGEDNQE